MNETPTIIPDPNNGQGATHAAGPASPSNLADLLQRPLTIAVVVLAIVLVGQIWSSHNQMRTLREDVAKRLQKGDASNADTGALVRNVQEGSRELQAKVAVLENRASEAQSQQLALEQLYQDLSKSRDDWALAEIEQVLSTASQQLQLAGNVPGALIALQNADRTLSQSDKPQFITIRRAIGRDTEKLKALPLVDSTGVALRLDTVIGQIDTLPMLADETPALPAAATAPAPGPVAGKRGAELVGPVPQPGLLSRAAGVWHAWTGEMWDDVRQLIRIRSVDTPTALMLSPSEQYFLRENIKLRLLNARMALLSRNETAFRSDVVSAQDALQKYFDTRSKPTQTALAMLRQVQSSNLAIEMPTLADSLNAVRNYKTKP